MENDADIAHR